MAPDFGNSHVTYRTCAKPGAQIGASPSMWGSRMSRNLVPNSIYGPWYGPLIRNLYTAIISYLQRDSKQGPILQTPSGSRRKSLGLVLCRGCANISPSLGPKGLPSARVLLSGIGITGPPTEGPLGPRLGMDFGAYSSGDPPYVGANMVGASFSRNHGFWEAFHGPWSLWWLGCQKSRHGRPNSETSIWVAVVRNLN